MSAYFMYSSATRVPYGLSPPSINLFNQGEHFRSDTSSLMMEGNRMLELSGYQAKVITSACTVGSAPHRHAHEELMAIELGACLSTYW